MSTIRDVARRAGVSPVTVSRVINDTGNVNAITRARVERAIEELGYVPSVMARSLRSKRTHTLALLVSDVTNPFWTTIARGVEDTAQSRGYSVFLYNTDENLAKQQRYLDVVVAQRVDGVIIAPIDLDAQHLVRLRRRNVPTVVVDRRIEGWDVDSVCSDSISGARALVHHLIRLGHRRIAMLSGPANVSTARDRVAGYRMALSEAGMPVDPRLIKQGEYRIVSGEELAHQVLEEGLDPTAIFAANNTLAAGAIQAVGKRGLRIPQDVALVCFDDLPHLSSLFPFLTVAVQPAYDMGVNAAQLLLSRLDSGASLPPRHVVLPTRLIVRHSCGSRLREDQLCPLSLPLPTEVQIEESTIVKPLRPGERPADSVQIAGLTISAPLRTGEPSDYDKPDVNRLLKALRHQEADRVPHLELCVTSRPVYEYVLERELKLLVEGRGDEQTIAPEDRIEFAGRLGMDAVTCDFFWRPQRVRGKPAAGGSVETWADLDDLQPPPPLTDQLSRLERYLRAAQGTGVGVIAHFSSFFDVALQVLGVSESANAFCDDRPLVERLMDILLEHQEKVMRVVCDRFADDLALIVVSDEFVRLAGLAVPEDVWMAVFPQRLKRLLAPAREHDKLVALHTAGRVEGFLPTLHEIGFDAVHPLEPESNDVFEIKRQWAGRIALMGTVPTALLVSGREGEIEATVREYCARLAPGGGYVLGSSHGIVEGVLPENLVAMTQAVHKYGRYGTSERR